MHRPWDDGTNSVGNAQNRARVAFEFIEKLGAPFYAFHDRDVAPEGNDAGRIEQKSRCRGQGAEGGTETHRHQAALGHGQSVFQSAFRPRRGTSCNADVFAFAAAQVKKAMEVTHELGGAGYTFWGGREGYMTCSTPT